MADSEDVELVRFSGLQDSERNSDHRGIIAPPKPEEPGTMKDKVIRLVRLLLLDFFVKLLPMNIASIVWLKNLSSTQLKKKKKSNS